MRTSKNPGKKRDGWVARNQRHRAEVLVDYVNSGIPLSPISTGQSLPSGKGSDSRVAGGVNAIQAIRAMEEDARRNAAFYAKARVHFGELVNAWWQAQDRDHDRALHVMVFPPECPCRNWFAVSERCHSLLIPEGTGVTPYISYNGEADRPWTAWDFALDYFVALISNSERDKFSGPCARCGKYYLKKRTSQKVYCSRICGNAATAVKRTSELWKKQRRDRLNLAHKALERWKRLGTAEEFQAWAARHYPPLTKKFLTRAINNEELPEPRRAKSATA